MKYLFAILLAVTSASSVADWHHGKLEFIAIGYDGKTITVSQEGFSKNNCTCYSAWPNRYCLDPSRETFEEEYALILSAKARDKSISIHIDENTCKIMAMYER